MISNILTNGVYKLVEEDYYSILEITRSASKNRDKKSIQKDGNKISSR